MSSAAFFPATRILIGIRSAVKLNHGRCYSSFSKSICACQRAGDKSVASRPFVGRVRMLGTSFADPDPKDLFLGLPDLDPLVRDTDPVPDPSIIKQK
jgi:hypothetical protein